MAWPACTASVSIFICVSVGEQITAQAAKFTINSSDSARRGLERWRKFQLAIFIGWQVRNLLHFARLFRFDGLILAAQIATAFWFRCSNFPGSRYEYLPRRCIPDGLRSVRR